MTTVAYVLAIIGALNWGLVGIGILSGQGLNVVSMLLGQWPTAEAIVYVLVGLSGLWLIVSMAKGCKDCACCGPTCEPKK